MCFNEDAEITTTGTTTSTTGSTVCPFLFFPQVYNLRFLISVMDDRIRFSMVEALVTKCVHFQISGTWTTTTSLADDYYDNSTTDKSTTNTSRTTRSKESKTCTIADWSDFRLKISKVL